MISSAPRLAFAVFSLVLGLFFAGLIARSPLQIGDNVNKLAPALNGTITDVLTTYGEGTYRPLGPLAARAVVRLVGPHEATTFRLLLAAQFAVTCVLLAFLLRVTSWRDAAAGTLALSVLLGHHAFRPTAIEGYPLNHFGLIALYSLAAVALIRSRPRRLNDYLAATLALVAAFTLESGVLVTGIFLVARPLGFRGISGRGVTGAVAALLLYVSARVAVLPAEMLAPSLGANRSGFGLEMLDPDVIQTRFGAHPWLWRCYNIVSAVLSVLCAEPRQGQWELLRMALTGTTSGARAIEVGSSCVTSGFVAIATFGLLRRDSGITAPAIPINEEDRRLAALCVFAIAANAVLCWGYVKEDVLSTAAVFYAIAVYLACRRALAWAALAPFRNVLAGMTIGGVALIATLWALRASDTACEIRFRAFVKRTDWALAEPANWPPQERALGARMRQSYVELRVPPPRVVNRTLPCLIREP